MYVLKSYMPFVHMYSFLLQRSHSFLDRPSKFRRIRINRNRPWGQDGTVCSNK